MTADRVPQATKLIFNLFPVTKDYTATGSKNKRSDQKLEQLHLPVALTRQVLRIRRSIQALPVPEAGSALRRAAWGTQTTEILALMSTDIITELLHKYHLS